MLDTGSVKRSETVSLGRRGSPFGTSEVDNLFGTSTESATLQHGHERGECRPFGLREANSFDTSEAKCSDTSEAVLPSRTSKSKRSH